MPNKTIRATVSLTRTLLVLASLNLIGCAAVKMQPATATPKTIEKLRSTQLNPAAVGDFTSKDPSMDVSLSGLRGSSLSAANGRFSLQLKEQLLAELKASGLYDETSKLTISAQLTDSKVDAAIGEGSGRLAAKFVVKNAGVTTFEKELTAESTWESSFAGPIAIPRAMTEYEALYKALVAKLLTDTDFLIALKR